MFSIVSCLKEVRAIAKKNQIDLGAQLREIIDTYKVLHTPITTLTQPERPRMTASGKPARQLNILPSEGGYSSRKGQKRTKEQRRNISRGIQLAYAKRKLAQIQAQSEKNPGSQPGAN